MADSKGRMTERDLERACSDALALDNWRSLKTDPVSDRARGKGFGEVGMADYQYIRYQYDENTRVSSSWHLGHTEARRRAEVQLLWIEWKRRRGKATPKQREWIARERARGALVWLAGEDFEPTVEGFLRHYADSGLMRTPLKLGSARTDLIREYGISLGNYIREYS